MNDRQTPKTTPQPQEPTCHGKTSLENPVRSCHRALPFAGCAVSSVGRALPRHGRGHWFKSSTAHHLSSLIFLGILPLSPVFQKPVLHFLLALLEQDLVSEMLATIEDQEGHQSRLLGSRREQRGQALTKGSGQRCGNAPVRQNLHSSSVALNGQTFI